MQETKNDRMSVSGACDRSREKNAAESGKRPGAVRKMLRRLMQLSEEKTGRD